MADYLPTSGMVAWRTFDGSCSECGIKTPGPLGEGWQSWVCCNVSRCASCNAVHRLVTDEQRAQQTPFCLAMHFACAADGLGGCPICGAHISIDD